MFWWYHGFCGKAEDDTYLSHIEYTPGERLYQYRVFFLLVFSQLKSQYDQNGIFLGMGDLKCESLLQKLRDFCLNFR